MRNGPQNMPKYQQKSDPKWNKNELQTTTLVKSILGKCVSHMCHVRYRLPARESACFKESLKGILKGSLKESLKHSLKELLSDVLEDPPASHPARFFPRG